MDGEKETASKKKRKRERLSVIAEEGTGKSGRRSRYVRHAGPPRTRSVL